jgi:hypothetical protein
MIHVCKIIWIAKELRQISKPLDAEDKSRNHALDVFQMPGISAEQAAILACYLLVWIILTD